MNYKKYTRIILIISLIYFIASCNVGTTYYYDVIYVIHSDKDCKRAMQYLLHFDKEEYNDNKVCACVSKRQKKSLDTIYKKKKADKEKERILKWNHDKLKLKEDHEAESSNEKSEKINFETLWEELETNESNKHK